MIKTCPQEKINLKPGRDSKGRFLKGVSGNPSGFNDYNFVEELKSALESESKRQGYSNFAEVVAKRALQYETVLIAVLKKVCPDLLQHSGKVIFTEQERNDRIGYLREMLSISTN